MANKDVAGDKIIADQAKQIAGLKKQLAAKDATESNAVKDQIDYSKQLLDATTKRLALEKLISDTTAEISDLQKSNIKYGMDFGRQSKKIKKTREDEFKIVMEQRKLDLKTKKDFGAVLKNQQKIADLTKNILINKKNISFAQDKLNKSSAAYTEGVETSFGFIDDIDDAIKGIPVVGGILSKAIGLDTFKEEITKNFSSLSGQFADSINGTSVAQIQASEAAIAGFEAEAAAAGIVLGETSAIVAETGVVAAETVAQATAAGTVTSELGAMIAILSAIATALGVANVELIASGAAAGVLATELGTAAVATGVLDAEVAALAPPIAVADVAAVGFGASMWAAAAASAAALAPMLPLIAAAAAVLALVALIKKGIEVDEEITNFAKKMGVTKEEAFKTHHHLLDIAQDTKVIGANQKTMEEASINLNNILGTNVEVSKDMLETNVLLTKQFDMTSEAAAEFQVTSAGLGQTGIQLAENIKETAAQYDAMTGDSTNFLDIQKRIAKTSKSTLANYHGNVKALTLATIQAKKLGMTLDETAGVSSNLLDFEQNIQDEMTANVLTGKHMNMNAARLLALEGDSAGAAAAAVAEAGKGADILKMNVLQREAVAKAAGLSVEQLMKAAELDAYSTALGGKKILSLRELSAEQLNQLAASKTITDEQAKQMAMDNQKADAQDKINTLTDKLTAIFAEMAGPIAEIIDPLMEMIKFILPAIMPLIKFAFAPLIGIMDMFKGIGKMIDGDIMGGLKDLGEGIMRFFFAPFMLGFDLIMSFFPSLKKLLSDAVDWIGDKVKGILPDWAIKLLNLDNDKSKEASSSMEEASVKHEDDAKIDPSGGLVVSGRKGSFQLNKNDSLVAGTDLDGTSSTSSTPENGNFLSGLGDLATSAMSAVSNIISPQQQDNTEIASLLKQLIAATSQPVKINIGGRVIDEIEKQTTLRKTYNTKVDSGYGTNG